MPRRVPVPLGLEYFQSRHLAAANRQCHNLYAEPMPAGSKDAVALYRREGIRLWSSATAGLIRGMVRIRGSLYVVVGTALNRLSSAGGVVAAGGSIPGTGDVQLRHNGDKLVVLRNTGEAHLFDTPGGTGLTSAGTITHPSGKGFRWVEFFDQFMIYGFLDGSGFALSEIGAPATFDPLDVATPESTPDNLVMGIRDHRELLLFCSEHTEVWYNAGLSDFPFLRAPDGVIEVGCPAGRTVRKIDNMVYFVGVESEGGLSVRRLQGRAPMRVSTPAIDDLLDELYAANTANITDARAFVYSFAGHSWYVLRVGIGAAERVLVYDIKTGLWQTRGSSLFSPDWRGQYPLAVYGKVIVADRITNTLGYLDRTFHSDFDTPIRWETVTPPITVERRVLTFNRFELEIDPGQAPVTGSGSDAAISLSWSDDNGRTWSNEYPRSVGRVGEWKKRLVWTRLGSGRNRIFRLRGEAAVNTGLVQAWADVEVGP